MLFIELMCKSYDSIDVIHLKKIQSDIDCLTNQGRWVLNNTAVFRDISCKHLIKESGYHCPKLYKGEGWKYIWEASANCAYKPKHDISSQKLCKYMNGTHIAFIGDSVQAEMAATLLTFLDSDKSGCDIEYENIYTDLGPNKL